MPNIIGSIPEFDTDGTEQGEVENQTGAEEVLESGTEAEVEETSEEEKETPTEPPAEEKPGDELANDTGDPKLNLQVEKLAEEKAKLLEELKTLRGQRREIKQQELIVTTQKIDELKDVNPQDVEVIDKILRAKGYMTKQESSQMFYEAVKQEEVSKFLEKYPEYKPENDPNDLNWNALKREVDEYRPPADPHQWGAKLEKAVRSIKQDFISDRGTAAKKRQIQVAGLGAGGTQRSSSRGNAPSSRIKQLMAQHTDLSEEEINELNNE